MRLQRQEYCGRVVVHDQRRFGPCHFPDHVRNVLRPRTPPTRRQVVLEIAVAAPRCLDRPQGPIAQRRSPQVGVNDYTRGIDHPPRRILEHKSCPQHSRLRNRVDGRRLTSPRHRRAHHFDFITSSPNCHPCRDVWR